MAYAATGWLLVGLLQLMVMLAVIAPLERWRPVEPLRDRAAVRTDVIYTLVHRLGLVRVVLFFRSPCHCGMGCLEPCARMAGRRGSLMRFGLA